MYRITIQSFDSPTKTIEGTREEVRKKLLSYFDVTTVVDTAPLPPPWEAPKKTKNLTRAERIFAANPPRISMAKRLSVASSLWNSRTQFFTAPAIARHLGISSATLKNYMTKDRAQGGTLFPHRRPDQVEIARVKMHLLRQRLGQKAA